MRRMSCREEEGEEEVLTMHRKRTESALGDNGRSDSPGPKPQHLELGHSLSIRYE